MKESINLCVWRLYSSESREDTILFLSWWNCSRPRCDFFFFFYSQHRHLSCRHGRLLAALVQGRNFTLIGNLHYDHGWHWLSLASARHGDAATPVLDDSESWGRSIMIISIQTRGMHTAERRRRRGSIQSINIVEQSVTVTEPDTVTMLKFRQQKPICLVLTADKQFFLYPARQRERERKKCILRNWLDVDRQSQINMLPCDAVYLCTRILGNLCGGK